MGCRPGFSKTAILTVIFWGAVITLKAQPFNKPNSATQPVAPTVTVYTPGVYGTIPLNYVQTWEAKGPFSNPNTLITQNNNVVQLTTEYVDGLGRPLQRVIKEGSPGSSPQDIVSPIVYDEFGREAYKFMPYVQTTGNTNDGNFKSDPFNNQKSFLQNSTLNPGLAGEQVFYGKTEYDGSPLNRVTKEMAPGNSWTGNSKGVSYEYRLNDVNDHVKIWTISNDLLTYTNDNITTNIPVTTSEYSAGQLMEMSVKNEDGNEVVEYKDKNGLLVLKKVQVNTSPDASHGGWLCTYYVYDEKSQLRFVIPPAAVEAIATDWILSTHANLINEFCFRYEYDYRGRLIGKKTPGAAWVYMVYDMRDRLTYLQDGRLRENDKWNASFYDVLNRPLMSGIIDYSGTPVQLQQFVDNAFTTTQNSIIQAISPHPSDLYFNQREVGRGEYKASVSVTFTDGFESEENAEFTAEIVAGTATTENVQVQFSPLPSGHNLVALTMNFYDNYEWTNKVYQNQYASAVIAGSNLYPVFLPASIKAPKGELTGTKVRVITDPSNLNAGSWLESAIYYDDKGRVIQQQTDNYRNGKDVVTNLYDFTGKVLSTYAVINNPSASDQAGQQFRVRTDMEYDQVSGKLLKIRKVVNNDAPRLVAQYEYDMLGNQRIKKLGSKKDENGVILEDELEKQVYEYNIRGWLKGINKVYANSNTDFDASAPWFGMELNYDCGFDENQLTANIAGSKWRSKGDDVKRAYGFGYDKASRLMNGDFSQHDGSSYIDDNKVKFDVKLGDGANGGSAYDPNGNIKFMQQWGLKLGGSEMIDDLQYHYYTNSNKLSGVSEQNTGATNHKLGDFTDKHAGDNDYGYDVNGNLITDLNKKIDGTTGLNQSQANGSITYNYFNLPYKIDIKDDDGNLKGVITYIYDANGVKLEKKVKEEPSSANNNTSKTTVTSYLTSTVYENDVLQFIQHEEGRIRFMPAKGGYPARYNYDYFVKDHLGNIRMVLTEERQNDTYWPLTFEGASGSEDMKMQDMYWENANGQSIDIANSRDNIHPAFNINGSNGSYAIMLKKSTGAIGAAKLLKVMSGDKIHTKVDYFFANNTNNSAANGLNSLVGSLLSALPLSGSVPGSIHEGATAITNQINVDPGALSFFGPESGSDGATQPPKAYLHVLLFDEMFNLDAQNSFVQRVANTPGTPGSISKLTNDAVQVKKNGYAYLYISNESEEVVYFDNLLLTHERGPLVEETHYYPFGLTMAGISSKALSFGAPENKYNYNGKEEQHHEFSDGSGLETYDFGARIYDPQIGRWQTLDPIAGVAPGWTPYRAFYNNPINFTDPTGLLEFESYEAYRKYATNNGFEILRSSEIGSQGHWTEWDRIKNTNVWSTANEYNLSQERGYEQYTTIEQRASFYSWFQNATDEKGFETRWAGAASDVAFAINELANPSVMGLNSTWLADQLNYSSPEARSFANTGNRMIFEDVFSKLQSLYKGTPLTGAMAKAWDAIALSQEQNLIQPLYENTSAFGLLSAASKQLLAGSSILAKMKDIGIAPFPKNGNLMNVGERWQYGMGGMGYNVAPAQMPGAGRGYTDGTMYSKFRKSGASAKW